MRGSLDSWLDVLVVRLVQKDENMEELGWPLNLGPGPNFLYHCYSTKVQKGSCACAGVGCITSDQSGKRRT
jgi:hypothetical protein